MQPEDLSCNLFIDTSLELPDVVRQLAVLTGGEVSGRRITSPEFDIFVAKNKYGPPGPDEAPTPLLTYPYYLELGPGRPPTWTVDMYIEHIGRLMHQLVAHGMRVAAACDFEDRLPGKGNLP